MISKQGTAAGGASGRAVLDTLYNRSHMGLPFGKWAVRGSSSRGKKNKCGEGSHRAEVDKGNEDILQLPYASSIS